MPVRMSIHMSVRTCIHMPVRMSLRVSAYTLLQSTRHAIAPRICSCTSTRPQVGYDFVTLYECIVDTSAGVPHCLPGVYSHACRHACRHVHVHVWRARVCADVCRHAHMCTYRQCPERRLHLYTHVHAHVYMHACIRMRLHTCPHTHVHTHDLYTLACWHAHFDALV